MNIVTNEIVAAQNRNRCLLQVKRAKGYSRFPLASLPPNSLLSFGIRLLLYWRDLKINNFEKSFSLG